MRIFTDESGNRYEAIKSSGDGHYVIKPIKAKKLQYKLSLSTGGIYDLIASYDLTAATAQKVTEAIEALMEYIQRPYPINPEHEEENVKFVEADEARAAFQEENNG